MKSFNRVKLVLIVFILFFLILIYRLIDIQLISTESFSKLKVNLLQESVRQRTEEVVISDGRGSFIDRNGESLSIKEKPAVIAFPFIKDQPDLIRQASEILHIDENRLNDLLSDAKKPVVLEEKITDQSIKDINNLKAVGIYGVYMEEKINERLAMHALGVTNEDPGLLRAKYPDKKDLSIRTEVGTSGLERTFDEFLLPETETKLLYHVDGKGNPLFGMDVKYSAEANAFYPLKIQTTLDKKLQESLEAVLRDHQLTKGGAVLVDIENSSIAAMASKPDVNMSDQMTMQNLMLSPVYPGSVFKTVIAAAAIENGLDQPSKTYDCNLNLYGEQGDDKGRLSFKESFAESCNYTFTQLAEEMTTRNQDAIEDMAEKLTLTQNVGWEGTLYHQENFRQLYNEPKSMIWKDENDKRIKKAIDQTAIGQKDVKITPLQAANMMATIARGGEKEQIRLVEKINYKNNTTMYTFKEQKMPGKQLDRYTVQKMQKLLRQVVTSENGTGRRFQDLPYQVAGKSGTAETGLKNDQGKKLYHKWFAGYFPADQPKYALVVVHMDTTSEQAATNPVYYDYVKKVYEIENGQK
ncbi:penicillin-binding protein 2 [Bacillus gobiensis]|uniref:peptidoglycan D,D-transpeptidase FtsI family protein n=1 Tax=Bacillus gobiensis TaxID=1441095 RepID=UPI003D1B157C